MTALWKYLLGLALVLPVGGYVAGSLAASATEDPAPREVIVIREGPSRSATPTPGPAPRPSERPTPATGDDDSDDQPDDDRSGVPVVSPQPDDLDDDDRDDRDDRDGDDDDDDDRDDGDDD